MKFPDFKYAKATSLAHALALLEEHEDQARLLAGGQSLLASLSLRLSNPELLIDINDIEGLSGITKVGKTLEFGALTRHVDVLESDLVKEFAPLLSKAMPYVAHVAVRNRGTIGGSLSLADPAAELPAITTALDASFELASTTGARTVKAREFFLGLFETAKLETEMLTKVVIPIPAKNRLVSFSEVSRRKGDFAIAGAAVTASVKKSLISRKPRLEDFEITFFGVEDRPVMAPVAASHLSAESSDISSACDALDNEVKPSGDLESRADTKSHLIKVLLRRAVVELHDEMNGVGSKARATIAGIDI